MSPADLTSRNTSSASGPAVDNDAERIKAAVDRGASAAEVAEEGYRVCRINQYVRKELRGTRDQLRKVEAYRKKEAVQDDAMAEMREELATTRKLLDSIIRVLLGRRARLPSNIRTRYDALKSTGDPDWRGHKAPKVQTKKKDKKNKASREPKEEPKIPMLLHSYDGETYDLRPPVVEESSGEEEEEVGDDVGAHGKKRQASEDAESHGGKKPRLDLEEGEIEE